MSVTTIDIIDKLDFFHERSDDTVPVYIGNPKDNIWQIVDSVEFVKNSYGNWVCLIVPKS